MPKRSELELVFIKAQRDKQGEHSVLQIGQVDIPESARLNAAAQKREIAREAEKRKGTRTENDTVLEEENKKQIVSRVNQRGTLLCLFRARWQIFISLCTRGCY